MRDALKRSERGDYRTGRSCGGSSLVAVAAATRQDYQRPAQIGKSSHVIIHAIYLAIPLNSLSAKAPALSHILHKSNPSLL